MNENNENKELDTTESKEATTPKRKRRSKNTAKKVKDTVTAKINDSKRKMLEEIEDEKIYLTDLERLSILLYQEQLKNIELEIKLKKGVVEKKELSATNLQLQINTLKSETMKDNEIINKKQKTLADLKIKYISRLKEIEKKYGLPSRWTFDPEFGDIDVNIDVNKNEEK